MAATKDLTVWSIHVGKTGDALLELLLEHYEDLDAKYRAEIPLKRVYIPEPAEEAGEV